MFTLLLLLIASIASFCCLVYCFLFVFFFTSCTFLYAVAALIAKCLHCGFNKVLLILDK